MLYHLFINIRSLIKDFFHLIYSHPQKDDSLTNNHQPHL